MNKSIPPFYVGQKVVAIESHPQGAFKSGDEFNITSVRMGCCLWEVTIGLRTIGPIDRCTVCGLGTKAGPEWWFRANRFRAITEMFQAVTFSEVMERELTCVN